MSWKKCDYNFFLIYITHDNNRWTFEADSCKEPDDLWGQRFEWCWNWKAVVNLETTKKKWKSSNKRACKQF